ncbi:uncharacterized protein LOC144946121 [Lampetra fluviatilis]
MPEVRERRLRILPTCKAMGKPETRVAVQSEPRTHDLQGAGPAHPGATGYTRVAHPRGHELAERRCKREPTSSCGQLRGGQSVGAQQLGPLQRFRRAARVVVLLHRLLGAHSLTAPRGYTVERGIAAGSGAQRGDGADILFDVSTFKAKQQDALPCRARRLLAEPRHGGRTDREVRLLVWALRPVPALRCLSGAQQRRVARAAWLARYPSKRVLVQQGQMPQIFYICLSGSAIVTVRDSETGVVRPVWFLSQGDKFGEKEIVGGLNWQCTVIIEESAEFLCLFKEDFEKIFLSGSSRTVSDPDQHAFLSSLGFLKGWPIHLLQEKPGRCLVSHHRRGSVITKDSSKEDWIYIIRSGSCSVLKECRLGGDEGGMELVTDSSRRARGAEEGCKRQILLSSKHCRRLRSDASDAPINSQSQNREHSGRESFQGDASSGERLCGYGATCESPIGLHPKRGSVAAKAVDGRGAIRKMPSPMQCAYLLPAIASKDRLPTLDKVRKAHEGKHTRTVFIRVDTLDEGREFGLVDALLGTQSGFALVSDGAECLLVPRQLFLRHAPPALLERLKREVSPYPSQEQLSSALQTELRWLHFRRRVLKSAALRSRRLPRSHDRSTFRVRSPTTRNGQADATTATATIP